MACSKCLITQAMNSHGQVLPAISQKIGAGNGTRTRDPKLGRLALYQLSYSRNCMMVEREGFEPSKASPADLQSAPFGHSGTSPRFPSIR
jgi:hypothetical protein